MSTTLHERRKLASAASAAPAPLSIELPHAAKVKSANVLAAAAAVAKKQKEDERIEAERTAARRQKQRRQLHEQAEYDSGGGVNIGPGARPLVLVGAEGDEQMEQLAHSPSSYAPSLDPKHSHIDTHGHVNHHPPQASPVQSPSFFKGLRGRRGSTSSTDSSSSVVSASFPSQPRHSSDKRPSLPQRSASALSNSFKAIVSTAMASPSPVPTPSGRPSLSRQNSFSSSARMIPDPYGAPRPRSVNSHMLPPSTPREVGLPPTTPRSATVIGVVSDGGPPTRSRPQSATSPTFSFQRRPSISSLFSISSSSERLALPPAIGAAPLPVDLSSPRPSMDSRRQGVVTVDGTPRTSLAGRASSMAMGESVPMHSLKPKHRHTAALSADRIAPTIGSPPPAIADTSRSSSTSRSDSTHEDAAQRRSKIKPKRQTFALVVKTRMAIQAALGRKGRRPSSQVDVHS
ncbi:hypothetical protein OC834_005214 [Tilletia horrida]|nr:hypothetical protein OC834_005214 [Tilletia horrida]